jgi:hypothetical protein
MNYKPDFGPKAAERLWQVNPRLGWKILDAVDVLCTKPAELSKPFYFRHPIRYQAFETRIEDQGRVFLLTVLFHYAADETTLLIADLIVSPMGDN